MNNGVRIYGKRKLSYMKNEVIVNMLKVGFVIIVLLKSCCMGFLVVWVLLGFIKIMVRESEKRVINLIVWYV